MKMEEKYIKRRTVLAVLAMQVFALIYVGIFIYGIMH